MKNRYFRNKEHPALVIAKKNKCYWIVDYDGSKNKEPALSRFAPSEFANDDNFKEIGKTTFYKLLNEHS